MTQKTTTPKTNGTNGHSINPDVTALLAQLAAALAPKPAPVAACPVPAVKVRRPRKPASPAITPLPRVAVDADHVHTVHTLLEAYIPDADHCRSRRPGAGMIVRAACACGCICDLEIPAADAEVMAQTVAWHDDEGR